MRRFAPFAAALMLAGGAASAVPAQNAAPSPAEQSDHLRQTLHLEPGQETAVQAFVAAMQRDPAQDERMREAAQRNASLPTPQRLDAMVAQSELMRDAFMKRVAATRVFYAQLSPAQKHAFDTMAPPSQQAPSGQRLPPGPPPPPPPR